MTIQTIAERKLHHRLIERARVEVVRDTTLIYWDGELIGLEWEPTTAEQAIRGDSEAARRLLHRIGCSDDAFSDDEVRQYLRHVAFNLARDQSEGKKPRADELLGLDRPNPAHRPTVNAARDDAIAKAIAIAKMTHQKQIFYRATIGAHYRLSVFGIEAIEKAQKRMVRWHTAYECGRLRNILARMDPGQRLHLTHLDGAIIIVKGDK